METKFETEICSFDELEMCVGHEVRFAISGEPGGIVREGLDPKELIISSDNGKDRDAYCITPGMFGRGLRLFTVKEK